MRLRFLLFAFLSVFLTLNSFAQCLEIQNILVDACGNPEGSNEMVRIQTGGTALNTADIFAEWGTAGFTWQGVCQNANTASRVAAINASIVSCGLVLEPPAGIIPPNSSVIIVTSDTMNVAANSFAFLSDTIYLIFQCAWTTQGHFANYNASPGIRELVFGFSNPAGCSDTVEYDRTQLVNIFGLPGGSSPEKDGASVEFTANGTASYYNNGCQAPFNSDNAGWSFTDEICNDYGIVDLNTLLAPGSTSGGTWTGPRVTISDYDPTGYLGIDSITYTVISTGACADTLDSTIVFNVTQIMTGSANLQSCDSVFFGGSWYSSNATFADTTFAAGYSCDSITNVTITIQNAITDSTYLVGCDSVVFNGTTYTSSIILRDTILGTPGTGSSCSQLFISEYVEGSSNNKALEIYNGTGIPVNLANYSIERYTNGNATASLPVLNLSGTLADGDVFVIINSSGTVNAALVAASDLTSAYINHNGNDAYALLELGVVIDVFGNIGCDPGTEWTDLGNGTRDNGYYRQANYTAGVTDPPNAPCTIPSLNAANWVSTDALDDFSNFGTHAANCGSGGAPSCDSVFITNIVINPINQTTANATSCNLADTGTVVTSHLNQFGCDSTHTIITTLGASNTVLETLSICDGDSAFLAGAFQTTAGSYYDTLPGVGGGPSVLDTFYTETFDGAQTWTLNTATGANGADNNFWVINNNEGGMPAGSCGAVGGNNSLHITSVFFPNGGAAYDAGGLCGILFCPETNQAASSGAISTLGRNNLSLEFDFISGGDGLIDNASVLYSIDGGTTYLPFTASIKSLTCVGGQGLWEHYALPLPANAENIADLRVRINWTNNDDGVGTDPSIAINDVFITSQSPLSAACDTIVETQLSLFPPAVANPINLTACDSVAYNGTTYLANTNFTDTITSSNNCDSIYNQVTIVVNQTVTTQNPSNPIVICSVNDSTQLADGTFVFVAGTYPIVYTGGSAAGCDSTYVTVVQTQNCGFTCTFDTVLYDSYETPGLIPGLVPGSTFHPNTQSTANAPFIGLAFTGTRFFYMNFQNGYSGQVYTRTVDVCAGADFRYSFWIRQFGNGPGSDFDINIYEGVGTGGTLIYNQNIVNNGTVYNQISSPQLATTTNQITFELITNNPGGNGNDLCLDDLVFEICTTDSLSVPAQNYCNNAAPDNLYAYVNTLASTNGTWTGPSALGNGHLGTFDPTTNAFGTYYYTAAGIAACGDTIISINTSSSSGQEDTLSFTACDSLQNNGVWYFTSTILRDTIIGGASNGCDSIFQTEININQSVVGNNPGNPFTICAANDSVQLPGGAFASAAGNYIFTFAGGAANGCDSTVLTEVITEICNCTIDLGPDTSLCQGESIVLDAGPGFDTYTWQDNSMNQTLTASTTGTYHCTVTYLDSTNNLVSNGDFEQGNTGFTTDYGPGVGGPFGLLTNPGTYAINTSPSNVHNNFFSCTDHTSGTGNLMIVNGSNVPNTNVWCQNITVTPNTDYLFSAWAISLENTNAANVATLNFLINGAQFGTSFSPSLTACDWQQFSTTWNSGANVNIQICIESDVIAGNNDYGLDDIFFTPFCNFTDTVEVTVNPIPTPNIGPDLTICLGEDTLLDATTVNATYLWQDGVTTTATFNATTAGVYSVDVTVNGCTGSDSITLTTTPVFNQTANLSICDGDSAFLENAFQTTSGVYTDNFTTSSNCDSVVVTTLTVITAQTNTDTITVCEDELPVFVNGNLESLPGVYNDTVSSDIGCDSIISITQLIVNPVPTISLGADTSVDQGITFTINVIGANATDTYTWINDLGESFTGESIQANATQTSEYILTATNEFNCFAIDSIIVMINPLQQTLLQIPTAFSPNGDGINEVFRIANYEDFESYTLRVYNRWGELIFDNEGYNVSWNGEYKEVPQNIGSYVYYIQATPMNGSEDMIRSGNVTLIK